MTQLICFFQIAFRHLRRDGRRNLVAVLCIAFGVMSLVAMLLVSQAIQHTLVLEPRDMIGADLSMSRQEEDTISPAEIDKLAAMQQQGLIDRLTLVAHTSSLTFRVAGSGELHFIPNGLGIDPAVYPLAGTFSLATPSNTGLATLLSEVGDILMTRDLAQENHLSVGDAIILSDLQTGSPVEGYIRGIVADTPNHQGSKLYYNLATAEKLSGGRPALNLALATSTSPQSALSRLKQTGWDAYSAEGLAKGQSVSFDMFEITLKGAGIMGLLVGGIGIANTMQVLLRRRKREVAIWKTLGYRSSQLQTIFAMEAALLGVLGSLLGAAVGVAISYQLTGLITRTGNMLIVWKFEPLPVLTGALAGILTTVIFAMLAIVSASRAQPLELMRDETMTPSRVPIKHSIGLLILLGLPFTALTSWIMGSALKGTGVLLFALAGLVFLGGFLGGLAWIIIRVLPLRKIPLARMAQNSLRRRGLSLIFAMIALFTGVISLGFGVVVVTSAQRQMDERNIQIQSDDNLMIIAPSSEETSIRAAALKQGIDKVVIGYEASVRSIRASWEGGSRNVSPVLMSRSEQINFQIDGAGWGSSPDGAYVFKYAGIPTGSQLDITLPDGSTRRLTVVGTYDPFMSSSPIPQTGLLLSEQTLKSIVQPDSVQIYLQAPVGQVQQTSMRLGQLLAQSTVINLLAYASRYTQTYQNLFVLAVAMAGLALLAGVLLVANSVNLAMLDRRYEIGVLKTIGYTRGHILFTLVVEYSLVALIATCAGLAGVQTALYALGLMNSMAARLLVMPFTSALTIGLVSVGLTLLTVLAVTWKPACVSPIVVLNERE